tara:strand:- start:259 stop:849 length:591 start_codon:yes stop_codon:yes gene_type:complete
MEHLSDFTESLIADAIKKIWLLCRYSRGSQEKGTIGPLMILLSIEHNRVEWKPIEIDPNLSAKVVFATAAGVLNGDKNTHAVLFLFDSAYGGTVLYQAWMMMVFSRLGIGPVAIASLHSCRVLFNNGPSVHGKVSDYENAELVETYLESIEDIISTDAENPPEYGFSITEEPFSLDRETGPEYFKSLLKVANKDWN